MLKAYGLVNSNNLWKGNMLYFFLSKTYNAVDSGTLYCIHEDFFRMSCNDLIVRNQVAKIDGVIFETMVILEL